MKRPFTNQQKELLGHLIAGRTLKQAGQLMNLTHGGARSILFRTNKRFGSKTSHELLYRYGQELAFAIAAQHTDRADMKEFFLRRSEEA
jgi:hypothetical protein